MKLYGIPPTRALRPIWLINELGLDCEIVPINPLENDLAGLGINPAGKVPVLVDGDVTVFESVAIQLYLADKHPEAGFIPADVAGRAQMHQWNYFLVTEIEQPLWRIALNTAIYDEKDRVVADLPNAERDARKMLAVFEDHMKDRQFVVGDRLSVADFNAAYTLDWADEAGFLDKAPTLKAWVDRMYARPTAPQRIPEAFKALQASLAGAG